MTCLTSLADEVEQETQTVFRKLENTAFINYTRILKAFRQFKVSDFHLQGSTGYGYDDQGREILEKIYAQLFGAEKALVRGQVVSGTHAIALCLYGILRPGDELLTIQGAPYDTLAEMIGIQGKSPASLKELGVVYRQVDLLPDGNLNWDEIKKALNKKTRLILLQRSRGYRWTSSLKLAQIKEVTKFVKERLPEVIIFIDNCYGEFVDTIEPTALGVDLAAGSLLKNPGGGLAPTGGYVVGKRNLVELAADRWTAPGLGAAIGPSLNLQRLFFQGLFLAPHVVKESLKGAVFAACLFAKLGFPVSPTFNEKRTDIIQAIALGSPKKLVSFCRAIQEASPVNAHVCPEPAKIPGYAEAIIMAAGTFVQGSSIELSADGPMHPPYIAYLQGGLAYEHIKLAVLSAAHVLLKERE